jgi:triacylglycerol lipase
VIESLDGIDEINFVTHSMGGLVVRAYSMDFDDPRIKRFVMLGTPNQGAELADITHQYWLLRTAAGPGARQLGTRADGLIPKLPVPKWEFAVIAGSRGTADGWNPLIPGDDDGTVTVESTKLPGAADFATVRAYHSRLLWNEESLTHTVNFIKDGRLRSDGEPQPIPETEATTVSKQ